MAMDGGPAPEARSWLRTNKNACALAGNRFASTQEAVDFVDRLYRLGAVRVTVENILDEEWRLAREGGPYADTLRVQLPHDAQQRQELLAIHAAECAIELGEADAQSVAVDQGQATLLFWWD